MSRVTDADLDAAARWLINGTFGQLAVRLEPPSPSWASDPVQVEQHRRQAEEAERRETLTRLIEAEAQTLSRLHLIRVRIRQLGGRPLSEGVTR